MGELFDKLQEKVSKKKLEELKEKEINNMKIEDLIKNKPLFTKMLVEECINYRKLEANNIRMGADWEEIDKARNRRFLLEYFLEDYDSKAWYNLINVQFNLSPPKECLFLETSKRPL
jgi:hypothetical protein